MTSATVKSGKASEKTNDPCVDVWLADPGTLNWTPGGIADCLALLDREETERFHGFLDERDRRCFLAAHVLVRTRLSRYAPLEPAAWRFTKNAFGRPEISGPGQAYRLRFNLSHTRSLVACAITRETDIGIDVEDASRPVEILEIAERFFAPQECDMLCRASDHDRQALFYAIWTLKEAYIKARGEGLSLPLDRFAFELSGPDATEIRLRTDLEDDPASWRFHLERTGINHFVAIAVRRNDARLALQKISLSDAVGEASRRQ